MHTLHQLKLFEMKLIDILAKCLRVIQHELILMNMQLLTGVYIMLMENIYQ